jgi:hypothetical protein
MNGTPIHLQPATYQIFTDASMQGWGGYLDCWEVQGEWTAEEKLMHINALELLAVTRVIHHFQEILHGASVEVASDNTTTVAYIMKQGGTKSQILMTLTQELYTMLEYLDIKITCRHIPGRLNVLADSLSRKKQIIPTEWSLHPSMVQALWSIWDRPMIDLFATKYNAKLPTYVSPVPDQEAWAVDALSLDWTGMYAYAYPPTAIISEVLAKVSKTDCCLILVAPAWPNQSWYPLLLQLLTDFPRELPNRKNLLRQPRTSIFHTQPEIFKFHAWKISSKVIETEAFLKKLQTEWLDPKSHLHWQWTRGNGTYSPIGVLKGIQIPSLPLLQQ